MKKRSKRVGVSGAGIFLVIVLTLVFIVTTVALFRMMFSGQVTDQAMRYSLGAQAENLARSAVAEMMFEFRRRVNNASVDPSFFKKMREEVYAGKGANAVFTVDTITNDLRELKALLAKRNNKRFELETDTDDTHVKIAYQTQFRQLPYERYGTVVFKATVSTSLDFTHSIRRTITVAQGFKIALISTPRPYDQTLIFIQDPSAFIREANPVIEEVLSAMKKIQADRGEIVRKLNAGDGPSNGAQYATQWQNVSIPSPGNPSNKVPHKFDEPVVFFIIASEYELNKLHIRPICQNIRQWLDRFNRSYDSAKKKLFDNFSQDQAHSKGIPKFEELMKEVRTEVKKLVDFQEAVIEYGGAGYAKLENFTYKLRSKHEWESKAFYTLTEGKDGKDTTKQLQELLDDMSKDGGCLNGIVYVKNKKALDLPKSPIPGQLVVVTEGKVVVDNTKAKGDNDLLTVVSFGGMEVDGKVRASLMPVKGSFYIDQDAKVEGNIVFDVVRDPRELKGWVKRRNKIHSGRTTASSSSGAFLSYYYVAVSPRIQYEKITRN